MSDFAKISELVTQGQQLLDSIKGGAIRTMQTQFDALKNTINAEWNSIKNKVNSDVNTAIAKVDDFSDSFHYIGSFFHKVKAQNWVGDYTHFNYILVHIEPNETEDVNGGANRWAFVQSGKILTARCGFGASLKHGVISFFAGRGHGGASYLSIESHAAGIPEPVVVKNFPFEGKLYRAIRFSPASNMNIGLNISVDYKGDLKGVGGDENWLRCVAIDKNDVQPGELV
ncbi:hypothetical protein ABVY39_004846 [Vibrio parahaemolyticus]